jgi:phosphate transport system substrate-binding protein
MKKQNLLILFVICLLLISGCSSSTSDGSENTQPSTPTLYIENKGSDTIVNMALAWAEAYKEVNPEVSISVTGGGSGTGLAALVNGTVDIANASRKIKTEEMENAQSKGYSPNEFIIARDAIAIIINPENPVDKLTMEQISQIYRGEINNWAEVGGEDRPIVRLSRETNSGTHVYFLESVIRLGDKKDPSIFSETTLLLPSSEGIIAEVRDNPNAIGYDGLGYITPEVKVIGVAQSTDSAYVFPSIDTVNNNTYPIARDLYMYTGETPSGAIKDYLDWIFTPEAQQVVSDLGFVPIISP